MLASMKFKQSTFVIAEKKVYQRFEEFVSNDEQFIQILVERDLVDLIQEEPITTQNIPETVEPTLNIAETVEKTDKSAQKIEKKAEKETKKAEK